jgi:hypothetical protein
MYLASIGSVQKLRGIPKGDSMMCHEVSNPLVVNRKVKGVLGIFWFSVLANPFATESQVLHVSFRGTSDTRQSISVGFRQSLNTCPDATIKN